jgi:NTE family protein
VSSDPSAPGARQLRSFARRVLGRRVGLVLSAGGAKGFAHLGALRCLEAAGIEIDLVAGTSMGAVVGAFMALGESSAELAARFQAVAQSFRQLTMDFDASECSLLRGAKKRSLLEEQGKDLTLADLDLPFWTTTADLVSGREVILGHGSLPEVLDAATAVPVIYPPVFLEQRALVDGWLVNPLPADILRREGAEIVIAVDVASTAAAAPLEEFARPPDASRFRLGSGVSRAALLRILRLALRAMEVAACERALGHFTLVDACIRPDLAAFSPADFHAASEMIERGQAAAEAMLPAIRDTLRSGATWQKTQA